MKKYLVALAILLVASTGMAARQALEVVTNPAKVGVATTIQQDDVRLTMEANAQKTEDNFEELYDKDTNQDAAIATNTAKRTYPEADETKLGNIPATPTHEYISDFDIAVTANAMWATKQDNVATVTQAAAEAGTSTTEYLWTPQAVKWAIDSLGAEAGVFSLTADYTVTGAWSFTGGITASNLALNMTALTDMKYGGAQWLDDTMAIGNANDAYHLWSIKQNAAYFAPLSAFANQSAFESAFFALPSGGTVSVTEQAADPTESSANGFYGATTSKDFFYKSSTGLWNVTDGTYTADTVSCTAGANTGTTLSETFDSTGYDNTWTESGTPDEDNTDATPLATCGMSGQILKASGTSSAYAIQTKTGTWGPEYVRFYVNVGAESLADDQETDLYWEDANTNAGAIVLTQASGQLNLAVEWNASRKDTCNISTDTTYRVEIYTNDSAELTDDGTGAWKVFEGDSETVITGCDWSGAINIASIMSEHRLGVLAPAADTTVYFDNFDTQSTGWIGK